MRNTVLGIVDLMIMPIITARQKNLTIAEAFEDYSNNHFVVVAIGSESAKSGHDVACKPSNKLSIMCAYETYRYLVAGSVWSWCGILGFLNL